MAGKRGLWLPVPCTTYKGWFQAAGQGRCCLIPPKATSAGGAVGTPRGPEGLWLQTWGACFLLTED